MMPVVLQKSIWSAKYRHPPFWAGSAAPRHFGELTIAGSLPIGVSHKPRPVPNTWCCTCNASTARIIANDSDSLLHKFS